MSNKTTKNNENTILVEARTTMMRERERRIREALREVAITANQVHRFLHSVTSDFDENRDLIEKVSYAEYPYLERGIERILAETDIILDSIEGELQSFCTDLRIALDRMENTDK